jgi:hypothetical protein
METNFGFPRFSYYSSPSDTEIRFPLSINPFRTVKKYPEVQTSLFSFHLFNTLRNQVRGVTKKPSFGKFWYMYVDGRKQTALKTQ